MTRPRHAGRHGLWATGWGVVLAGLLLVLSQRVGALPPLGTLLDPHDGLYRTARLAIHPSEASAVIPALDDAVTVLRDDRGVPHIFASSDRDALIALGYVVAQDRLFQMDFLPRVAAGRLAEVFGPGSVAADRFLRRTGMEWGARKNAARIITEQGVEYELITRFTAGVNAYVEALREEDLPFEFRLLGFRPERFTVLHAVRMNAYFAYDLTYRSDAAYYGPLKHRLGKEAYARLYPRHSTLYVPIIPPQERTSGDGDRRAESGGQEAESMFRSSLPVFRSSKDVPGMGADAPGKGSNNWVVAGSRSATGAPILAGDMHLQLTLPAIWYEAHLATPTMNTYGVTAPGTPLPLEAFTDHVAWAFTNTGADVIDHLLLDLDETGTRYRYGDGYRDLEAVLDTIIVSGAVPVVDTLYYAHWGPVVFDDDGAIALRWVAHDASRTLRALWDMHHARTLDDVQEALRFWDTPMQNIVQADVEGNVAIRSTGYLPVRRAGHGAGLLDGSTDAYEWVGRVPFDDLPHARNPEQGFLTSTNQQPADSTYPYYLGHDWRSSYRSLRIDSLLRSKATHSLEDVQGYQADVHAMQRDLFVPVLDTLTLLPPRADSLRRMLLAWDGDTGVDRPEPLVLDEFLTVLNRLAWDEEAFGDLRRPAEGVLYSLLRHDPTSEWLDVQATDGREDAAGLLRLALTATADTLAGRYGWGRSHWRWGDYHKLLIRHLTQSPALRALWRGPLDYPGFDETLSPAGGRPTTHSASWRVVVDFSQQPPVGYGVYPGGQSGNPFSPFYALHVPSYVHFEHYRLLKPATPQDLDPDRISSRLTLRPGTGQ